MTSFAIDFPVRPNLVARLNSSVPLSISKKSVRVSVCTNRVKILDVMPLLQFPREHDVTL